MKKVLLVLFLVFSVFACVSCNSTTSNWKMEKVDKKFEYVEDKEVLNCNSFAYKTFKELYKGEGNYVYSPASFYIAMSMCAEASCENTFKELKAFMEFKMFEDVRDVNKALYTNNYYNNDNGKACIANSMWVKKEYTVIDTYEETLKNYYNAEINANSFDDKGIKEVATWINKYTFNFFNVKTEDLSELKTVDLALVNTIYFNNKWAVDYKEKNTYKEEFNTSNGIVEVDFMHHSVSDRAYLVSDKFEYATDNFYNGNKIHYVLPKDGYSVSDCFDNDLYEIMNNVITKEYTTTINYSLPKFKIKNTHDLKENAKSLGVNDLFDPDKSNLSNMVEGENLYVSFIKQIAGIEINEEGAEAAAVTIIGDKCTSAGPSEEKEIDLKLNKPFFYYITDSAGCIIFMGVVNNPSK